MTFQIIKDAVNNRFNELAKSSSQMYVLELDRDLMFNTYLAALPEDERQGHNCNCCKNFIRNYGSLLTIKDGVVSTLWDFEVPDTIYANVPISLRTVIGLNLGKIKPFVTTFAKLGTDSNVQLLEGGVTHKWTHFFGELPRERVHRGSHSVDSVIGSQWSLWQVWNRALAEITVEATETVLELIAQNSLYRGAEKRAQLQVFLKHQKAVEGMTPEQLALYCWEHMASASGIRSDVIGTLLVDLSEGRDVTAAVASYETKAAPANYQRTSAPVTKGMAEKAANALMDAGLDVALPRRHAVMDDVPVSNVLFVNRSVTSGGSLLEDLKASVTMDPKTFSRVEEVSIERFLSEVIPTAQGIEVLLENRHAGNLMNLTSPCDPEAPKLFGWDSGLAWVYKDGNADSVKERVKAAGGNITGFLRISLDWYNFDDLDLHVWEPNGNHIYFPMESRVATNNNGGLDVDMNAGEGNTRTPVENIVFREHGKMLEGTYRVQVKQFRTRTGLDKGFGIEIEVAGGETLNLTSPISPREDSYIDVATIEYHHGQPVKINPLIVVSGAVSKELFGMHTNQFQKVKAIILSPNHWDGQSRGNKHTFFILEGARTEQPIRGFFNEFLKPSLAEFRKFMDLVAEKTKVAPAEEQLAGLGFSSTLTNDVIVRVTGATTRVIKVKF